MRRSVFSPRGDHSVIRFVILALVATGLIVGLAKSDEPNAKSVENAAPQAEVRPELAEVIDAVRANEALFHDLDATYRVSWKFHPQPPARQEGMSFGPPVVDETAETHRQVTQGDRLHFSGSETVTFKSGKKLTGQTLAICNGTETVVIDEGNSATVFQRRYEPPAMFPPHCWGLFTVEVNFPLSVYLQGTEAMKSHPKVRRFPVEAGSVFEFYKVEAESLGEEMLGDLACVKIKVNRWHYTKDPPGIQYLWLAKDRNYHVAQCRSAWIRQGQEVEGDTSRVVKWREMARGVWLPAQADCESVTQNPDAAKPPIPLWSRRLILARAALNPELNDDLFQLPKIPDSLPRFVVGADGRLVDGPLFPKPVAAAAETSLESILERLVIEEAGYPRIEFETVDHYVMLNRSELRSGGVSVTTEEHSRHVLDGKRMLHRSEQQILSADGTGDSTVKYQVYDGGKMRGMSHFGSEGDPPQEQTSASLSLAGADDMQLLRAHTFIFRGDRNHATLSELLKSGWYDKRNQYAMTVEYVGDDRLGDLHCHRLKCTLPNQGRTVPDGYFFLWLARNRNLIPVRMESHEPMRSDRLPTGIRLIDDIREIRPGQWFPYNLTYLAFQAFSRGGLSEGRPLLQWRQDVRVDSLMLEPAVDDAEFSTLEVDEGTQISVTDAHGDRLGQFKQPQTGNIDVTPERLLELRQAVRVGREEAARRQQALDALIGKPAPPLTSDDWLNSPALSWKQLEGKVVVIDFWAVWCGPCIPDLEKLAEVHKTWQDNGVKDRVLIGIHTAGTSREAVEKIATEKKLGYSIIIDSLPADGQRRWGTLFDQFAVTQIPFALVVDKNGKIAAHGRLEEMLSKASELASEPTSKDKAPANK